MKNIIYYDTYSSIINSKNERISFITFAAGVSDREIREELTTEFTDLSIPLDLLDDCMSNSVLSYENIYVYINEYCIWGYVNVL